MPHRARACLRAVGCATCLSALVVSAPSAANADDGPIVTHTLRAYIEPEVHRLRVHDQILIPAVLVSEPFEFRLNAALTATSATAGITVHVNDARPTVALPSLKTVEEGADSAVRIDVYHVSGAQPGHALRLDLDYAGVIDQTLAERANSDAGATRESTGLIETRGVYLTGATHWVPEFGRARMRYQLQTDLPAGWKSVSQGDREVDTTNPERTGRIHETWRVDTPTQQVHLVAARFTEYARTAGEIKTYAFLRTPDPSLAARYLDATARYLAMYQAALGTYPYGKFALVENFWETGYGMPSFTLLGEQILRFPFILTSSYPHELLHNWWGNGVFVDLDSGNWCEGLTAYLADHLLAEQQGQGNEYRRDILTRVGNYVTPRNEVTLGQFLARHDAASEAIGYGKAAMVWNMLREHVGDAQFLASLRRFYHDHLFKVANYADIRRAFERTTGEDLRPFFQQWIEGTGLPELALTGASRSANHVSVTLAQTQSAARFALDVPVVIQTAQGVVSRTVALPREAASVTAQFDLAGPALRIDVDPQFQVYRRLNALETSPSLSQAFGAERALIVVPTGGRDGIYAGLLKAWGHSGVDIAEDLTLSALPTDRPVWVLGRSNRFLPQIARVLAEAGSVLDADRLWIGDTVYPSETKSLVVVACEPKNPASVLIYLSAPTAAAADGLARKLPHYGKYSWLVFGGEAPDIEAKGEWASNGSPLTWIFEQGTRAPPIPPRKALADLTKPFGAKAYIHAEAWQSKALQRTSSPSP